MKRLILLILTLTTLLAFDFAPDGCDSLIFFKEGTKTTMTHFNDDGKVTGSTKVTYKKVDKSGSKVTVLAASENYDKKGKLNFNSEWTARCENGTLFYDLKSMMPQQQGDAYKDFDMTVEGLEKEFPSNLTVGSSLRDANVKFTVSAKGGAPMPMMNLSVNITNRKVEAKETVSTSAGSFDCFKISEETETKTLFKIKFKTVYWFSAEAGVVKVESYKENGKFIGKSELTELSR